MSLSGSTVVRLRLLQPERLESLDPVRVSLGDIADIRSVASVSRGYPTVAAAVEALVRR
jgi:hypothetical protein